MFCVNCGKELREEFVFCPECGEKVTGEARATNSTQTFFDSYKGKTKVCKKCGEEMPEDSFYCLNCGNVFPVQDTDFKEIRTETDMQTGTWRNKWIALLLCIFLGWLGIHRFYEGKVVTGLLYMFTLGLFGIGWVVDIIRIACKPTKYRTK